ncbi:hypothetical protein [Streptomyces sp. NPDC050388]|uniref:hypothetical protein n=1 Tax=Streptomyces sp. NPDC050388 TaxID=3155781 RepID=UPI00343633D7
MASRPQSKFARLADAEFQQDLRRLAADAHAEPVNQPTAVTERYDIAVLAAS